MKLGILNGGGDCAGLNAVTRAVVRKSEQFGYENVGIRHGWQGLLQPDTVQLRWSDVSHIINQGGTILKGRPHQYTWQSEESRRGNALPHQRL
jgi:6-phosphofructokinase 1